MKRCYVLYLVVALLFYSGIDHQRVVFKTLDYLANVPRGMEDYAVNQQREFPDYLSYDAIRYYKNYVGLFPDSAPAKAALGFCYYHNGNLDKAQQLYTQAAVLEPELFGLQYNLGIIFLRQGKYQKAFEALSKAASLSPISTIVYPGVIIPGQNNISGNEKEKLIRAVQDAYKHTYQLKAYSKERLNAGSNVSLIPGLKGLIFYPPVLSKEDIERIKK